METDDLDAVRNLWLSDPAWSVYALADLQDPVFRPHCRWFTSTQGEEDAVVLFFSAFDVPVIIAHGSGRTVERIISALDLPDQLFAMVKENHHALLSMRYAYSHGIDPMTRMVLDSNAWSKTESRRLNPDVVLRRLTVSDEEHVRNLFELGGPYAPGAFFSAYQIEQGVFYGAYNKEGNLLAVGGTHVVDHTHSAAAIGNMYTHPQQRKKGLATTIVQAIIADLQANSFDTIVLNVNQQNHTARKIYEASGFRFHCNYIEGMGTLKH